MRRFDFPRLFLVPAVSAALLSTGCIVHLDGWDHSTASLWGQEVETRGDVLYVDDVALPYERWADVSLDLGGATTLEVGTATGELALGGGPGSTATLSVLIHSEVEGDGQAVLENSRLLARSSGGHKVFINAVKGTVPAGLALTASSGTGPILLEKLSGSAALHASNGTGEVTLRGCSVGTIRLESGTGDVRLEDGSAPDIGIESGTGDALFVRCKSDRVKASMGTGDVELVQCTVGTLDVESGTGDVIADGGRFEHVTVSTGTGDFTRRNDPHVGDLHLQ